MGDKGTWLLRMDLPYGGGLDLPHRRARDERGGSSVPSPGTPVIRLNTVQGPHFNSTRHFSVIDVDVGGTGVPQVPRVLCTLVRVVSGDPLILYRGVPFVVGVRDTKGVRRIVDRGSGIQDPDLSSRHCPVDSRRRSF